MKILQLAVSFTALMFLASSAQAASKTPFQMGADTAFGVTLGGSMGCGVGAGIALIADKSPKSGCYVIGGMAAAVVGTGVISNEASAAPADTDLELPPFRTDHFKASNLGLGLVGDGRWKRCS